MATKWKRLIAREGLVFLGVLTIACLIVVISQTSQLSNIEKINKKDCSNHLVGNKGSLTDEEFLELQGLEKENCEFELRYAKEQLILNKDAIQSKSLFTLFILYALYLIPIRFSIWAIRTLKEK